MKPHHWMAGSRRFEMVPLYCVEKSGNEYPVTLRHTPRELNSQPQCCEYSKSRTLLTLYNNIKDLANEIIPFRNALKMFLLINSFYNSKEYFNYQRYSIEN